MIKRLLILSIFIFGLVAQAQAGAGGFFGISYNFGASAADWGVTAKIMSDDDANTAVVAAGVSYFPFAKEKKFGADLSGGYLFENGAVTLGFDFLQWKPQLGLGYIDTEDGNSTPATPAASTPPAEPEVPEGSEGGPT
ncbi:MAG: hypothetical protein QM483_12465 [Desulfuromusa sp.]